MSENQRPAPRTRFSLGDFVQDGLGLAGVALITWGVHRIYDPAAYIVGGGFLLIGVWLAARKGA